MPELTFLPCWWTKVSDSCKNPELRSYVFTWYTAIRKQNGMMILAGNSPAIMLDTAAGVGMWENTSVRVYFYMEQSAVRLLSSHADLPSEIQDLITQNEGTQRYILENHKRYDELIMHVPPEEHVLYKNAGTENRRIEEGNRWKSVKKGQGDEEKSSGCSRRSVPPESVWC
ncbi:hypothetical protein ACFTAO_34435 [Paenibacillus rhizoplanae]